MKTGSSHAFAYKCNRFIVPFGMLNSAGLQNRNAIMDMKNGTLRASVASYS
jgi:hypothetical protein